MKHCCRKKVMLFAAGLAVTTMLTKMPEFQHETGLVSLSFPAAVVMAEEVPADGQQYTCPMHPHYISDDPGTCPICGMDLVTLQSDAGGPSMDMENDQRSVVTIPAEMIQSMGIRTGVAEQTQMGLSIRAFGSVAENTRLKSTVASRVNGWIVSLKANAVGDQVSPGDLLYRLYSPELISAQQDYISAIKTGSSSRTKAAERRLKLLGVDQRVIGSVRKSRKVIENVPFHATAAGTVTELGIEEGGYVTPKTRLMTLQSFETVWIEASVAEKDLTTVAVNQSVSLSTPSLSNWQGKGNVSYIYPTVDARTRTGLVRVEVDNAEGLLKPGAYIDVLFDAEQSQALAVPSEAVLRSSKGAHLVTVQGLGRFLPVRVTTGAVADGYTQILSGLENGQEIVVSGQFLIDSESALRESFSKLKKARVPISQIDIPESDLLMIDHFIDAGLYVHEALIDGYDIEPDYLQGAVDAGTYIAQKYEGTKLHPLSEQVTKILQSLQAARTETEISQGLDELSLTLEQWISRSKAERYKDKNLFVFKDQVTGRLWMQLGSSPDNPYGTGEADVIPYVVTIDVTHDGQSDKSENAGGDDHALH